MPSPLRILRVLLALGLALLAAHTDAHAAEGANEINQATVEAAGGFPFVISQPGKYVLTGDLAVPADTQAILLLASDVYLDLNGFRIEGPFPCSLGSCAAGTVNGISGREGSGRRITVTGGAVRGFSGTCIQLLGESLVRDAFVSRCGRYGIELSQGSLARDNRVSDTGLQGMRLVGREVGYGGNVVYLTGHAQDPGRPDRVGIDGGTALSHNVCLRGACVPRGRRFYLTVAQFEGNEAAAPGNCEPGFHFASFYEIVDPTQLSYDHERGPSAAPDLGEGPPSGRQGWVRTGYLGGAEASQPGAASCRTWSSNANDDYGTVVSLGTNSSGTAVFPLTDWSDVIVGPTHPWVGGAVQCSLPRKIWCVEDR